MQNLLFGRRFGMFSIHLQSCQLNYVEERIFGTDYSRRTIFLLSSFIQKFYYIVNETNFFFFFLFQCECSDEYCEDQKRRTEICRPQVMKSISEPVVSCRVAQWICAADALCSTALEYYNHYCRAMFHGKKCTPRCTNSINILQRQEKAAKLTVCKCDGLEDYDCPGIQRNMKKLCFLKRTHHHQNATKHARPTEAPVAPPDVAVEISNEVGGGAAAVLPALGLIWTALVLVT